jgi:hypothetical protein
MTEKTKRARLSGEEEAIGVTETALLKAQLQKLQPPKEGVPPCGVTYVNQ